MALIIDYSARIQRILLITSPDGLWADEYSLIRSEIVSDRYPSAQNHTVDVELVSQQKLTSTAEIMLGKHSLHANYNVEKAMRTQFHVKTLRKIQKIEAKNSRFFQFFHK